MSHWRHSMIPAVSKPLTKEAVCDCRVVINQFPCKGLMRDALRSIFTLSRLAPWSSAVLISSAYHLLKCSFIRALNSSFTERSSGCNSPVHEAGTDIWWMWCALNLWSTELQRWAANTSKTDWHTWSSGSSSSLRADERCRMTTWSIYWSIVSSVLQWLSLCVMCHPWGKVILAGHPGVFPGSISWGSTSRHSKKNSYLSFVILANNWHLRASLLSQCPLANRHQLWPCPISIDDQFWRNSMLLDFIANSL